MTEITWDEEWRPIPHPDDLYRGYEVSDHGNVRSFRKRTSPWLLKRIWRDGYPTVNLPTAGGFWAGRKIHQLVMRAFVGPCPRGLQVAHLNGDRTDARLVNLAYVTPLENSSHKAIHGTILKGEENPAARLLGWQVAEIKFLAEKGCILGRIGDLFGIGDAHVSAIIKGRIWSSVPAKTDDELRRWAS